MSAKHYILGVDIGGTKLGIALTDRTGKVLEPVRLETKAERGPQPIIADIISACKEVLQKRSLSGKDLLGIGISAPGPMNTRKGVMLSSPNLPRWDRIEISRILRDALGARAVLENDANAAALAEYYFGAGRGYEDIVYLTMSTGIGGGIIVGGRLHRGKTDTAGEVGHHVLVPGGPLCGCGNRGCYEALCSGSAIARQLNLFLEKNPESPLAKKAAETGKPVAAPFLFDQARAGDPDAREMVEETANYMGWGLANLANILDPEIFILGTLFVKGGDLLMEPTRKAIEKDLFGVDRPVPHLVPAALGDQLAYLAGASIILHAEKEN